MMKQIILLFLILPCILSAQTIVPQAENFIKSDEVFVIKHNTPFYNAGIVNEQSIRAIGRLREGLQYRTRMVFSEKTKQENASAGFVINANSSTKVFPGMDESYSIKIDTLGIQIKSNTTVGALRAVETVLQLVEFRDSLWVIPTANISDKPQFAYRGLLLDPARRFLPVDALKRNINAMAAVKLNVLHLHLSDDQGWRMESKRYPSLHIMASDGKYYTQSQITNLVQYATERGILIIPEIDIPGHATAILTAKPLLASKEGSYSLNYEFGIHDPVLNPAKEETYTFLSNLFKEVDSLFPGPYIHIGGDEVKYGHWEENPSIDAFRNQKGLSDFAELQYYFINRVTDSIRLTGKTIIGWQEIYGSGLKKDAVVQCWQNSQMTYNLAKQGYKTILSKGFYLDLYQPLKEHYETDIIPKNASLKPEERKNVLGAEACLWGELVDDRTLDFRLWPRLALIADRFWSDKKRDRRQLATAIQFINVELAEHGTTHLSAPYGILYELAGSRNINPLIELRELVTPVKGYLRHTSGNHNVLTPLNSFADAADTDPANLDRFYKALREFIIAGDNEENFNLIAQKLYDWESFYEINKGYFNSNNRLKELEPLAKNLSDAARIASEAMELIVRGKEPKDTWLTEARAIMEEAKKPVCEVELTVVEQLEKLITFSKDHDVIVF